MSSARPNALKIWGRTVRAQIITVLLLIQPALAVADTSAAEPSLLGASLKMVAALAVICGLLLLFYAASRRGFGFMPHKKNELIQILETRPLGGRKFLCVVKVRGEEFLLGMSHDRIENLGRIPSAGVDDFAASLQRAEENRP
jgi:flagellar protein FliO/FliZ